MLRGAVQRLGLSARAYHRVLCGGLFRRTRAIRVPRKVESARRLSSASRSHHIGTTSVHSVRSVCAGRRSQCSGLASTIAEAGLSVRVAPDAEAARVHEAAAGRVNVLIRGRRAPGHEMIGGAVTDRAA